jgi:hypothetical protein
MNPAASSPPGVSDAFGAASSGEREARSGKTPAPFSLRLTKDERAYLDQQAGGRPLGTYIRERLLGGTADKRRPVRKPKVDEKRIALVLAELGRSRLSANLNQLAKAVNMGTLDVSQEVERELQAACRAVITMRDTLIGALGLKAEGGPSSTAKAAED